MRKIFLVSTAFLAPLVVSAQTMLQGPPVGMSDYLKLIIAISLVSIGVLVAVYFLSRKFRAFKILFFVLLGLTGIIFSLFLFVNYGNARTYYRGSVTVKSGDVVAANESQQGNFGFGPRGFVISNNRLLADKDIPGFPSKEKYKEAVRRDISNISYVTQLEIDENSWEIETKYPWNAVY